MPDRWQGGFHLPDVAYVITSLQDDINDGRPALGNYRCAPSDQLAVPRLHHRDITRPSTMTRATSLLKCNFEKMMVALVG
jgi:hypothetical protein